MENLTDSQKAIIEVVKHGPALLARRNDAKARTVHAPSATILVKRGILEAFDGPSGRMVRLCDGNPKVSVVEKPKDSDPLDKLVRKVTSGKLAAEKAIRVAYQLGWAAGRAVVSETPETIEAPGASVETPGASETIETPETPETIEATGAPGASETPEAPEEARPWPPLRSEIVGDAVKMFEIAARRRTIKEIGKGKEETRLFLCEKFQNLQTFSTHPSVVVRFDEWDQSPGKPGVTKVEVPEGTLVVAISQVIRRFRYRDVPEFRAGIVVDPSTNDGKPIVWEQRVQHVGVKSTAFGMVHILKIDGVEREFFGA